jgi:hypothetical protein
MRCLIVECTRSYQKYCGNSKCGKSKHRDYLKLFFSIEGE